MKMYMGNIRVWRDSGFGTYIAQKRRYKFGMAYRE